MSPKWPVGTVFLNPTVNRHYTVQKVGDGQLELDGVWYHESELRRWIKAGVLTVVSEEKHNAEHSGRLSE